MGQPTWERVHAEGGKPRVRTQATGTCHTWPRVSHFPSSMVWEKEGLYTWGPTGSGLSEFGQRESLVRGKMLGCANVQRSDVRRGHLYYVTSCILLSIDDGV